MKHEATYKNLLNTDYLHECWKWVKKSGAKGGIDMESLSDFEGSLTTEIKSIYHELNSKTYRPDPYLYIEIPKNEKEYRPLGMLTIKDKIVQTAIYNLIEPLFEKTFAECSYAYRPNKGPEKAIKRVVHELNSNKYKFFLSADLDNFFDNIPHKALEHLIEQTITDKDLSNLILLCLKMGKVTRNYNWIPSTRGIPQGAILSPLLANAFLTSLDHFVLNHKFGYVRYADDFVIMCTNEKQALGFEIKLRNYVTKTLALKLNDKTEIVHFSKGVEFLGIVIKNNGLALSERKKTRLLWKIENTFHHLEGEFNKPFFETIQGIKNYYGRLLPNEMLLFLDEKLMDLIRNLLSFDQYFKGLSVADRKKALIKINFFTTDNEQRKDQIIGELTGSKNKPGKPNETSQEINIDAAIRSRKREYAKLEAAGMELIISNPGVSVGLTQSGLVIKNKGELLFKKPVANLKHISILTPFVSVSGSLIHYCSENKIPVDFFLDNGKISARMYSPDTTDALLWMKQLNFLNSPKQFDTALRIVQSKISNQLSAVKYYSKYHKSKPENVPVFADVILKMEQELQYIDALDDPDFTGYREKIMAAEGRAAKQYWEIVELLIFEETGFISREQRGSTDLANMAFNYGYGILYSKIWDAVLKAGLNPYLSILHAPQENKPTLVFDLIEEFRQAVVDKALIAFINKKGLLQIEDNKLTLETRKTIAEIVLEKALAVHKWRGMELRMSDIMKFQARQLAQVILGNEKNYKPFRLKW